MQNLLEGGRMIGDRFGQYMELFNIRMKYYTYHWYHHPQSYYVEDEIFEDIHSIW